jgi:hypothetical protein
VIFQEFSPSRIYSRRQARDLRQLVAREQQLATIPPEIAEKYPNGSQAAKTIRHLAHVAGQLSFMIHEDEDLPVVGIATITPHLAFGHPTEKHPRLGIWPGTGLDLWLSSELAPRPREKAIERTIKLSGALAINHSWDIELLKQRYRLTPAEIQEQLDSLKGQPQDISPYRTITKDIFHVVALTTPDNKGRLNGLDEYLRPVGPPAILEHVAGYNPWQLPLPGQPDEPMQLYHFEHEPTLDTIESSILPSEQ